MRAPARIYPWPSAALCGCCGAISAWACGGSSGVSAPARRAWRRSLQLRVVALTLVASSLLVGAFGWFVA